MITASFSQEKKSHAIKAIKPRSFQGFTPHPHPPRLEHNAMDPLEVSCHPTYPWFFFFIIYLPLHNFLLSPSWCKFLLSLNTLCPSIDEHPLSLRQMNTLCPAQMVSLITDEVTTLQSACLLPPFSDCYNDWLSLSLRLFSITPLSSLQDLAV